MIYVGTCRHPIYHVSRGLSFNSRSSDTAHHEPEVRQPVSCKLIPETLTGAMGLITSVVKIGEFLSLLGKLLAFSYTREVMWGALHQSLETGRGTDWLEKVLKINIGVLPSISL